MRVARPGAVSLNNREFPPYSVENQASLPPPSPLTPSWHTDKTFLFPRKESGRKKLQVNHLDVITAREDTIIPGLYNGMSRVVASSTARGRGDTTIEQESKNKIHIRRKDISNYRFVSRAVTSGGGGGGGSVARHPNPAPEPNTWEIRTIESRGRRTNGSWNDPEIIHRSSPIKNEEEARPASFPSRDK